MKKGDKHQWFTMTAGPNQAGRATRYYMVECRCGVTASHHAGSFTDDKLRKIFMRQGWEIGKNKTSHLCPECKHKRKVEVEPAPPPAEPMPQLSRLELAWKAASDEERAAFMVRVFGYSRPQAPPAEVEVNGSEVLTLPVVEVAEPVDEGDAPADWWTDLQKRGGRLKLPEDAGSNLEEET